MWALAFLTALGAAMRFASLDVQSFHHDEVITAARVIPGSFGDMLHAVKGSESNPPLYYVLAWGWAKAFGTHEVGLRSLSALFGLATVPLAYCIGAELASRRAGLIAAALIAVNPMLIWYSQEARSYAILVFFCAASLLFFARALRTRRGRDLAFWALTSALALCSHYFAVFAVAIEALWLLIALRQHWRLVLPAVGFVLAVGAALIPLISAQVNPAHIGWIDESLLSTRFFQAGVSFLVGETGHVIAEPPRERYALFPVLLIGAALPIVAARGSGRERRGALLGLVVGLGVPVLALAAALVGKDYVVERNLLPALVPLGIAAAIGFGADRVRRLGLLLALALCAYWIAFDVHVTETPNLQRPDFRAIVDELGPASGPRAIVTWKLAADPVRFYLHDHAERVYSGDWPLREIDVISKSLEGRAVTGVTRVFHPIGRVRFERLTLTRYMSARTRQIPFYVLKHVHTGFGFNAVVVDGQPGAQP
ncbi:MAG: mannosyltransferase [Solirubrobacterales bacterium]|jgi:4-amino-4-deoxy-L-arabinose transferase-like glycosyltransferase|nr:mannosyltransferase [Solirubrobacterales bacterium]